MASLSLSNITNISCNWSIDGLGNPFNTTYYLSAGVATSPVTDGQPSAPTGTKGSTGAPSSGSSTSATGSASGLNAGVSQILYGYAQAANGLYYSSGSASASTYPSNPTGVSLSASGKNITITFTTGSGATETDAEYSWESYATIHTVSNGTVVAAPSYNTAYTIQLKSYSSSDGQFNPTWDSYSVTTGAAPALATPSVSSTSSTTTTVTTTLNSVANATQYNFNLYQGATYLGTIYGPSNQATFTGLNASTQYRIDFYAHDSSGNHSDSNTGSTFITTSAPVNLTTPVIGNVTSKYKSADVTYSVVSNASDYLVEAWSSDHGTWISSGTGTTSPITVGGLSVSTTYGYRVQARSGGNPNYFDSAWSPWFSSTTLNNPSAPQFDTTQTQKGDGYVTLYWSSVSYASQYELDWRIKDSASVWSTVTVTNAYATITGLVNATAYEFKVRANVPDWGGWTGFSALAYATPGLRPANFSWSSAKTAGATFQLLASEWQALTVKINDFRTYKLLATHSFVSAVTNNIFTASMFNDALQAIRDMSPPTSPPLNKSQGNNILASYLNDAATSLNSIL